MKQIILTILLALFAMAGQAQNQDLEHLFQKYRGNPAIEFVNLMDSFPDAQHVKVAETFEFGDSLSLVRHFVEEYEQIKNFKKMKASKVIKIKGNLLMKMAMNQAFTVRLWEDENGYKDTVIEFDGCRYAVIHLGGFYKEDEIAKSEPNPITSEYGTHRFFPSRIVLQYVLLLRGYLHGFRRLVVLLHIVGSVFGVHRRSRGFVYLPNLALCRFLVERIEVGHGSSFLLVLCRKGTKII